MWRMFMAAADWMISGACLAGRALLRWRVFRFLRIALAIAVVPFAALGKDIRLRNELIHTQEKKEAAAAKAASDERPSDGLFLIQFDDPVTDAQREELLRLNVELVQPVPEDAFVARVSGTRLGALRRLSYVHWVGPLRAEHKIHAKLSGLKEKRAVSFLIAPNARAAEVAFLKKRIAGVQSSAWGG
jgi:hypothetical protein